MQNLSISKIDDDNRYCTAIFCFLKEYNICFCKHCAMISTDDTSKIKFSEPNYTISATTRGKRVMLHMARAYNWLTINLVKYL